MYKNTNVSFALVSTNVHVLRVFVSKEVIVSFLKLPLLSTHRALLLHLLRVQPLEDAVHVEAVGALAPDQGAVISRNLAWKKERYFGEHA